MSASADVFLEGTLFRDEARILFAGICKPRKMRSLRRNCLAIALHSVVSYKKADSKHHSVHADKADAQEDEKGKYLREDRWQSFSPGPRTTVPAKSSSAKNTPINQPEPPRAPQLPPLRGVRRSFPA